jgi:hypothetical protein
MLDRLRLMMSGLLLLLAPARRLVAAPGILPALDVGSGRVSEAIMLVNILPSAWLQDALEACSAVCFSRDRLRFTHQTGKVQTNKHNLGMFFFGPDVGKFQRRFSEFGRVLK